MFKGYGEHIPAHRMEIVSSFVLRPSLNPTYHSQFRLIYSNALFQQPLLSYETTSETEEIIPLSSTLSVIQRKPL